MDILFCISVDAFRQLEAHSEKNQNADPDSEACGDAVLRVSLPQTVSFPGRPAFFCFCCMICPDSSGISKSTEFLSDHGDDSGFPGGGTRIVWNEKSRISCEDLEEAMRSRYRDVIWTSIKIYGTKMTVDIQENLLPQEEYEAKSDKPQDIVAAKDGVITEMVTRAGTPLTAVGTEVKKGDILVSGRIEVLNDDGEIMQYLYRPSDADIKAKVLYSYRDVIDGTWVEMAPTGNTKERYSITLLDNVFDWPLSRNPFAEYQVQTESRQAPCGGQFLSAPVAE